MAEKQKTIAREVGLDGTGLFTGLPVSARLKPAAAGTGVRFVRKDLPGGAVIPADADHVLDVPRRTSLGNGGAEVHTVEHLLAALFAFGVDNVEIEVEGPEVPSGDGSALAYARLLEEAGVLDLDAEAAPLVVRDSVAADGAEAALFAAPLEGALKISYSLNYPGTPIGSQFLSIEISPATFLRELAPARTFCLLSEVEGLRKMGLGKGATTANTLVVGDKGIVENTLRFPDEFVRHKIVDLLGDLRLLGVPIHGHLVAVGSGHAENRRLLRRLKGKLPLRGFANGRYLKIEEIQRLLPHRYPFLLIDRVTELEVHKRAVGVKNVTINEPFFQGHFPGAPVMPGVLQVEAIAQLALMTLVTNPEHRGKIALLSSLEEVRFRRPVVPGDQLVIEANLVKLKRRFGEVHGRATVEGEPAAEAVIRFALVDREEFVRGKDAASRGAGE